MRAAGVSCGKRCKTTLAVGEHACPDAPRHSPPFSPKAWAAKLTLATLPLSPAAPCSTPNAGLWLREGTGDTLGDDEGDGEGLRDGLNSAPSASPSAPAAPPGPLAPAPCGP